MKSETGDCYAAANGMIVTARDDGSIPLNARVVAEFSGVVDEDAFDRLINSAAEAKRLQRAKAELLEALANLIELIEAQAPHVATWPDVEAARAAILKATGAP